MDFEFATVSRIIFGSGKLNTLGALIKKYGDNVLIVSGVPLEITRKLQDLLASQAIKSTTINIDHEPTLDDFNTLFNPLHQNKPDLVIGIGGGSAIDTAKVVSALMTNPGNLSDYLEIIGKNKPLINPSVPMVAIPTTAGTGSEVTRNAVIGSPSNHVKVSLRSPYLLPYIALIDPELTMSVPPSVTALTGLDALTQLIETYTCKKPNPLTDALCLEGIRRVSRSLTKVYDNGKDLSAREDMSLAALFSGLALANARLGAVHGLAGPIGGEIYAPHGAICASLLPNVLAINISALRERSPDHTTLERYTTIGILLNEDPAAKPETSVQWVNRITMRFGIKHLSSYGLVEEYFKGIIDRSVISSSMKGNPITLTEDELRNILQMSL